MVDYQKRNGNALPPNKNSSISKVLEAVLSDNILTKNLKYEISSWVLCSLLQYPTSNDNILKERIEKEFDAIEPCDFIPFQRLDNRPLNVVNMEDEVISVSV